MSVWSNSQHKEWLDGVVVVFCWLSSFLPYPLLCFIVVERAVEGRPCSAVCDISPVKKSWETEYVPSMLPTVWTQFLMLNSILFSLFPILHNFEKSWMKNRHYTQQSRTKFNPKSYNPSGWLLRLVVMMMMIMVVVFYRLVDDDDDGRLDWLAGHWMNTLHSLDDERNESRKHLPLCKIVVLNYGWPWLWEDNDYSLKHV